MGVKICAPSPQNKRKAEKLCKKPTLSIASAKNMINAAWGTRTYVGIEMEAEAWAQIFATEDQKEGMAAFLGKRKAEFKGR